jgi:anti-anti-sigma regulatory factor
VNHSDNSHNGLRDVAGITQASWIPIMTKPTCFARLITGSSTLILTLAPGMYGSLELDRLQQLDAELGEWRLVASPHHMIIDLSKVTAYGSGLLGCLARHRQQLALMGRRLLLCGDQSGLIADVGWSGLMNLQLNLEQALEHGVRVAV